MTDPSDRERDAWRRANEAFEHALDLAPDAREAFLARTAERDPALAADVRALVASHFRADTFIDAPAALQAQLDALARSTAVADRDVGHYRLLRVLGEGGMGVVYLARDTRLGRTVALKALTPRFAHDPQRTARLKQEARAAAALLDPGVATVFALEEIDGQIYIATEYVPGRTLRDEMADGPLPASTIAQTARAIALSLVAAHRAGIVHRDLKPENVMRTPDGVIKILDFGLARFQDLSEDAAVVTADGAALGTPAYMSPEQIRGSLVDHRSDLFALGVILSEMLCRVHPFQADTTAATIARILEEEPLTRPAQATAAPTATPSDARDETPLVAGLASIIRTLLRKPADARFQSATEVVEALDTLLRHASDPAERRARLPIEPELRTERARWWWQFHEVTATVIYVLLLAPLWLARDVASREWGTLLFLAGLVSVIVAGALRLHLCFAATHYPAEWRRQYADGKPWILASDVVLAAVLLAIGLLSVHVEAGSGVLLVASAAAVAVSALIIEPATTRAAFG